MDADAALRAYREYPSTDAERGVDRRANALRTADTDAFDHSNGFLHGDTDAEGATFHYHPNPVHRGRNGYFYKHVDANALVHSSTNSE